MVGRNGILIAAAAVSIAAGALTGCSGSGGASTSASNQTSQSTTQPSTGATSSPTLTARAIGNMPAPVQLPAVTPVGPDQLLAIGGLDSGDASVASITKVVGGSAASAGALPSAFHDAAAATLGSSTYVFGGGEGGATRNQILKLIGKEATQVGTLPTGSSDSTAAALGGTIYVVGGYDGSIGLSTILAFTPPSQIRTVAKLPVSLRYAAVSAVGGKLMIAGGSKQV